MEPNRFFDGVGVGQRPKNQRSALERGGRNRERRLARTKEGKGGKKREESGSMRHSIRTEHMHNYRASFAAVSTTHAFLNYAYAVNRASCLHTAVNVGRARVWPCVRRSENRQ